MRKKSQLRCEIFNYKKTKTVNYQIVWEKCFLFLSTSLSTITSSSSIMCSSEIWCFTADGWKWIICEFRRRNVDLLYVLFGWYTILFNNIKTNIDLVHMDDAQRWSYLEKAWEKRKKALYPDIIYLQNLFLLYLKVTI